MKKTRNVLTGEERKRSIIEAAKPLFAINGFHGTSIREIAKKADVSEALIYKHFPSKEALYEEILDYSRSILSITTRELDTMEPGTDTLVAMICIAIELITMDVPGMQPDQRTYERLLFQSLIGDITFARKHFKNLADSWSNMLRSCCRKAIEEGDVLPLSDTPTNRIWFVHHLAMAINLCHLSGEPAFEYQGTREDLVNDAVLFCLRGIGMTEEAINKHYRPDKLWAFGQRLFA